MSIKRQSGGSLHKKDTRVFHNDNIVIGLHHLQTDANESYDNGIYL